MFAAQSALAIKRERQKRASRSGPQPLPVFTKEQLEQIKPPKQSYSLSYFNVGAAFIIIGTFMVLTSVIPENFLGQNWISLIPVGLLFIVLGIIMIVINQLQTRSEEKQLESYVKARLGKSTSGAPLVRTPVLQDEKQRDDFDDIEKCLLGNNGVSNV